MTAFARARTFPGGMAWELPAVGRAPWGNGLLLALAGVIALRPLAHFWNANPDYFFGWGVPFLAAYLFAERWERRPVAAGETGIAGGRLPIVLALWGVLFFLVRMILETEPGWRPALWAEAALYIGAVLAWLGFYGGRAWMRHFAFPAVFLFLGVPWLFNFEFPIVQGLMRGNAVLVADTLVLLDIPAAAAGNTIRLADGQLGVDEACSGIRSLQAALAMSFFLGAFYHLPKRSRLLLPVLALVPTLCGNYGRLLFLALLTTQRGLPAAEARHDIAGEAALIFTLAGVWGCALVLNRGQAMAGTWSFSGREEKFPARRATIWAVGLFLVVLADEGATQAWYGWREATAPRFAAWTLAWPTGMKIAPVTLSAATRGLLDADDARTGTWVDEAGSRWTALWFRYLPHPGNKIALDAHNPERCLPAAGLVKTDDYGSFSAPVNGFILPVRAYRFGANGESRYVFWVAYLNRGRELAAAGRTGLFGKSWAALGERGAAWWDDAWQGRRGLDAETLEVAVTGPADEAAARRAYLEFLGRTVRPVR